MDNGKKIIGSIIVGIVIFTVGVLSYEALTQEKKVEVVNMDQLDCEIGVYRELDGTWRCLTENEHHTALALSNSEKLDLIIEKLNSGKFYIDYSETNGDFEMINEAIDCYNRKGSFSFEFWDNGVFKEWRCTVWEDGRDQ